MIDLKKSEDYVYHHIDGSGNVSFTLTIKHWKTEVPEGLSSYSCSENHWNVYVSVNDKSPLYAKAVNEGILTTLTGWNGGITFTDECKGHSFGHDYEYYKVGDDYNHLWDAEMGDVDQEEIPDRVMANAMTLVEELKTLTKEMTNESKSK